MSTAAHPSWARRAQPLLGTLVEVGVPAGAGREAALAAAFGAVRNAQACLSRFDPHSDLSRFHALPRGAALRVRPATQQVLQAARELHDASAGRFDVSLGSGPAGWRLDGDELHKLADGVRLDLGGIGKGHAVDLAVQALVDHGCAAGWVNAGGDLRAFGDVAAPIVLRDEDQGGVRPFATLRDGAFATSAFGPQRRAELVEPQGRRGRSAHVSVAAPLCLWADALTKVVAAGADNALLARYGASAWFH